MATEFDSGDGSKKQRTDEEGEQAAEEDRISALPDALRLHILGLLPFKSAIRTGALSTQWRALWTRRWPAPGSLDFLLGPHDSPQPLLESLEQRGRRRLDRFSLSFQIGLLNPEDFGRCLDYAADCDVADLDVNLLDVNDAYDFCFSFGALPANPHLARLSLSGICVFPTVKAWYLSELRYLPRPYSVLEVIHLHRVTVEDVGLYHLVAACPRLRTLDIRYCDEDLRRAILKKYRDKAKANLKSVTIVECESLAEVRISNSSSLRSFRYSGAYLAADAIPTRSAIEDLYICFGGPACRQVRSRRKLRGCWLDRLIKLSNLSVLTLCSSALRRVSAKARARSTAGNAASCKLQNLREVQLLMFAMCNDNLDDIMAFLMTCCTPRLERLFVQLPTRSNQYKPNEEPSESEEDESEEELPEVESSSEDLSEGEESEEDQLEQEESEEEESEEDHSQEDESEEDYSQNDESGEDHSQDDESEEDYSQDKSEEEGSEEEHPKEDKSDENGLGERQSKDGSKKELSDGGQSAEVLLGDGCGNLILLKMMNFMGHHNEMRLVSFVLKKSGCLNQLILFTPESDHPEGPQKDHLNISDFLQKKLLPLEKASPHAQIILSEPDAAGIKPFHSETFVKV
uniref:Uncharacterized protein n=1 Tax=Avena sativa TaxID=4498 RepID=A0ACD5XVU0_AVESA